MKTVCCVNSSCFRWSCGCFHSLFGFNLHHQIKLAYFSIILLFIAISLIVSHAIKDPSMYIITTMGCEKQYNITRCVASGAILRIFFSVAIVFFTLIFLTNFRSQKAKVINEGLWIIKLLWIACFISITLLMGASVFKIIQFVSLVAWLLYLFIQTFVIIDLAFNLTNRLKETIDLGAGKPLQIFHYIMMLVSYSVAIALNIYGYKHWEIPKWISVTNSVFIGLFLLLALFGGNKFNTVLLSGLILIYIQLVTYLTSKAIQVPLEYNTPSIWFFFTWFFLLIVTFCGMLSKGSGRIKAGASSINDKLELVTKQTDEQNMGYLNSNKWATFHSVMVLISFSIPIFISQLNKDLQSSSFHTMMHWEGIISWVWVYLVYIWSVFCIRCYPDRDLSELESYFKQFELS